jgi:hypothetical protein
MQQQQPPKEHRDAEASASGEARSGEGAESALARLKRQEQARIEAGKQPAHNEQPA